MIYWHNETYADINHQGLQATSANRYSYDNIFDSMMGLMDIESTTYSQALDVFHSCKSSSNIARVNNKLPTTEVND
tara:strand:- start:245 stop:472 length:228 start_codon:yes stop_codon:yes gene_type:complete